MISIPIAIFFVPYGLFLLIYLFFLFFNVYHIRIYAVHGFFSHAVATVFLLGTVLILGATWIILAPYDWGTSLDLEGLTAPFTDTNIFKPI
ncbi:MAG: hypothetical protein AAB429_01655 [Patescibacteria group bacterium]